jgi:opacity protein-like surface antigen
MNNEKGNKMKKLIAVAATAVLVLGAQTVAKANGTTTNPDCPPVHHPHHHKHHHHPHHHQHHHAKPQAHCVPACCHQALHSGWKVGLDAGYLYGKGRHKADTNFPSRKSHDLAFDGGLIGLFLGYDHYFCQHWMLGLEGTAKWTGAEGKSRTHFDDGAGTTHALHSKFKTEDSYGVNLRLGRRVLKDCVLIYGTAGAEWTRFKFRTNWDDNAIRIAHGKKDKFRTGWALGAGLDIPFCDCWTAGFLYKFTQYQRVRHGHNLNGNDLRGKVRPYTNTLALRVTYNH